METLQDYVFPVYVYEQVLQLIFTICKRSNLEIFGYLLGDVFNWKGKEYVVIHNQLYIQAATHSHQYAVAQLDGAAGEFNLEFQKLREFNPDLRILGWWHSHPVILMTKNDIETHRFFFPDPWDVCLIIDSWNNDFGFFSLDTDSVKGYKQISYAILSEI